MLNEKVVQFPEKRVEVRANVINQLKLLRQSTFKDKLAFIDENVQNGQRAGAKEVRIITNFAEKKMIIENDGKVLVNPQALFSMAESEWDEEIKQTENPFGMGFFSNITVSNLIEVFSGDKHIIFDVEKMIQTHNTEIDVRQAESYYDGFKLVLNHFDIDSIDTFEISERVMMLGKYIHELDIYLNGEKMEKKDLTQTDESPFAFSITNEATFKGWLSFLQYTWDGKVNIFYKGRLVTELENVPYLKGDLHISDRTLNLTSPDRKDIIRDEKFIQFYERVKEYVKTNALDAILHGAQRDIEQYASAISFYVNKEDAKEIMRFVSFKSKEKKDIEYLRGIALAQKDSKDIKSFRDYELSLRKKAQEQNESHFPEVTFEEKVLKKPAKARGVIHHKESYSGGTHTEAYVEKPEIKSEEIIEKDGEQLIHVDLPSFWMTFSEVEAYEYKLNIARHYELNMIIARNRIEEEVLRNMRESHNIQHISNLHEDITISATLSNTELSPKEKRALMVLDMIGGLFNFSHNPFAIGDLMVTKNIKVESLNMDYSIIEPDVTVIRDSVSQKVYIDRTIIDKTHLSASTNETLTLKDYKFILANLQSITEELNLLIGQGEKQIMGVILQALAYSK